MGRVFGWIAVLLALYFGARVYSEGIDSLLRRLSSPIEGSQREAPLASGLTPAAGLADSVPTDRERRVWVTDQVRERVNADMARGVQRYGRQAPR